MSAETDGIRKEDIAAEAAAEQADQEDAKAGQSAEAAETPREDAAEDSGKEAEASENGEAAEESRKEETAESDDSRYLRLLAEFQNYKKRVEKEKTDLEFIP